MLRIAICDDEKYYLEKVEKAINDILVLYRISQYETDTYLSGKILCENRDKLSEYDVIFLDIYMPDMNGLETAKEIRKTCPEVLLVFITAYIDYSLEGYKLEATRFLIKDVLDDMLLECMEAVLKKLKIKTARKQYHFIEGRKELFIDKIYYIESCKHKLTFHVNEEGLMQFNLYDKLDNIEKELSQFGFLRIHKSFLVNVNYINSISNYKVKLKDGRLLPVPRNKYQQVKEKYYDRKGEIL